jgi:hypothetical protein
MFSICKNFINPLELNAYMVLLADSPSIYKFYNYLNFLFIR